MTSEELRAALKRAYNLGQIYWQMADSDNIRDWKKADATEAMFKQFVDNTVSAFEEKSNG